MFKYLKEKDSKQEESLHKWLSTGSIFLPFDSTTDDFLENLSFRDADEESEITKIAEEEEIPNEKMNKKILPNGYSSCISYLSVGWLSALMWRAFCHKIDKNDLLQLSENDASEKNAERLEKLWKEEICQYGNKASLVRVVYRFCRTRALVSALIIGVAMVFQFISPAILLRMILEYIELPLSTPGKGILLAFGLFFSQLMRTMLLSISFVTGFFTGIRLQGAIQILLYNKLLRVQAIGEKQAGQVVNYYANDMERLFECAVTGVLAIATPVMFILTLSYSWFLLGPWALLGHLIILFFYPVMGGMAAVITKLRRKVVKHTDKRVQLMNEIITSIKLIKMYAWEVPFAKKVSDVRESETNVLQHSAFLQSLSTSISPSIVIVATVCTFLGHTLSGNSLDAPLAFTVFTVFLALQFSIGTLPYAVKGISEGRVALQRMQKLLQVAEVNKWKNGHPQEMNAIKLIGATFTWNIPEMEDPVEINKKYDKKNGFVAGTEECSPLTRDTTVIGESALRDITMTIKKGSLIGICGSIGSGKSSLLSALSGNMTLLEGNILMNGNTAFVTQQPWILNGTLRDNILFSLPFEKERYNDVIQNCCLLQDLQLLPEGDLTEIGERGVNLSGGQRQRVSLARALYSDRDLYLLDDPFSAVDTKVASYIFEHCIQTAMAKKTVILVTHAMHVLEKCEEVFFMKQGQITEKGTHTELMAKNGDYARMFLLDKTKYQNSIGIEGKKLHQEENDTVKKIIDNNVESRKLMTDEDLESGSVSWKAYRHYVIAMGGPFLVTMLLFSFLVFVCAQLFSAIWLKYWMDSFGKFARDETENFTDFINDTMQLTSFVNSTPVQSHSNYLDESQYQLIYAISVVVILLFGIVKGVFYAKIMIKAASRVHDKMFQRMLHSPMSFFETSPLGRILNRFSKDMDELDMRIPFFLEIVIQSLIFIILQFAISVVIYPIFMIALLLAFILFLIMDIGLNVGVRKFKHLDNILRSPVIVHLSTTVQGLPIIRTYGCESWFQKRFCSIINQHSVAHLTFHLAARWFTFRMEVVGVCTMGAAALTVVLMKNSATSGSAGLVLAALFQICTFIPYVMRLKSELLSRFTSLERVTSYCQNTEEESGRYITECIPLNWPHMGEIEFKNVCLRYRDGLPLVLNNVSFKIEAGQKIGVVGRTGAGKSSLVTCLMRLVELDAGSIIIDNIDISTLGRKRLRSSMAVIPQDPVLFEGTVRYNLDPFGNYSDDQLWEALDKAHLKYKIGKEEKQLEGRVEKNGDNFSVGERQLLCLARALLRKNKILILDEATASVDIETDYLIQTTIKEMFSNCTVITIAHRLNTILSSNKVLVMEAGKVAEFDTPSNLSSQDRSLFYSMLDAIGKPT